MPRSDKLASIQQHYYSQGQAQAIAEAGLTKEAKAGKLKKVLAVTGAGSAGVGAGLGINRLRLAPIESAIAANEAGIAANLAKQRQLIRLRWSRVDGRYLEDRAERAARHAELLRPLRDGALEDRVRAAKRLFDVQGPAGVEARQALGDFGKDGLVGTHRVAGVNKNIVRLLSGNRVGMERFLRDQPALSSIPKVLEPYTLRNLERAAIGPNTRGYIAGRVSNRWHPEADQFPIGRGVLSPEAIRELVGY